MTLGVEERQPAKGSRRRKVLILVLIAIVTFALGWLVQAVIAPILIEPSAPWGISPPGSGR